MTRRTISILLASTLFLAATAAAGPFLAPYVASRLYPLPSRQALALSPTRALSVAAPSETTPPPLPSEAAQTVLQAAPTHPSPADPDAEEAATLARTPTRIVIPAVGVDTEIVLVQWETRPIDGVEQPIWRIPDAEQAGWHAGSAALGQPGNTVINGHNWPQQAAFRDLYRIKPGDHVTLYSGSMAFRYQVAEVLLLPEAGQPLSVRQENARYIQPSTDERVTLVTCHPYGSLAYRLIVIARPEQPRPVDGPWEPA